jgi:hypothetical protein
LQAVFGPFALCVGAPRMWCNRSGSDRRRCLWFLVRFWRATRLYDEPPCEENESFLAKQDGQEGPQECPSRCEFCQLSMLFSPLYSARWRLGCGAIDQVQAGASFSRGSERVLWRATRVYAPPESRLKDAPPCEEDESVAGTTMSVRNAVKIGVKFCPL